MSAVDNQANNQVGVKIEQSSINAACGCYKVTKTLPLMLQGVKMCFLSEIEILITGILGSQKDSKRIVDAIQSQYGGIPFYIKKSKPRRKELIIADYLIGKSHNELSKKYGLCSQQVRRITAPARLERAELNINR